MNKLLVAFLAYIFVSMFVLGYTVKSLVEEHDANVLAQQSGAKLLAASIKKNAECLKQNVEWSKLVESYARSHSDCEATIDFNHALKSLDTAIKLQKQGKLPPPERP